MKIQERYIKRIILALLLFHGLQKRLELFVCCKI